MFDVSLLKPNSLPMLTDDFLDNVRHCIISGTAISSKVLNNPHDEFKENFNYYVKNNSGFNLDNIELFPHKEIIIGCHHYLDGLMIKHGRENLQVLEHDYTYYQRLDPKRKWSIPGSLRPNTPLVIATPFPGYLGLHPQFEDILQEATEKNIDVHLDGAWLSCSTGITVDLDWSCIKSIGISLSKGYHASWNRIGLRYTRNEDLHDPITIYDRSRMCPQTTAIAGILLLENVPMDYLWNTYGERYYKIVEHFDLEIGNILFAAYGKDRIIYGLKDLLV